MSDSFEEALKERQQRKKEQEAKKNFTFQEEEPIHWAGINEDEAIPQNPLIGRIVGNNPAEKRKQPWEPKIIFWSKILDDQGGYYNVIWKQKEDYEGKPVGELDPDWILMELYKKVRDRKWSKFNEPTKEGKTGEYIYNHVNSPVFKRMESNQREGNKYPPRFYPSKRIVMNFISRNDSWSKDHKKCVLLSNKHNFWKNDEQGNPIYFTDPGIVEQVYDLILENVAAFRKGWNLDVILWKTSKINNAGKTEVTYHVADVLEDKFPERLRLLGNAKPLTTEELGYEKYDLDKRYSTTSYTGLLKRLGNLFKEWDTESGANFYERLVELVKKEQEGWAQQNKGSVVDKGPAVPFDEDYVSEEQKKVESEIKKELAPEPVPETPKARRASTAIENLSIEQLCVKHFPAWDKLNSLEKEFTIKGIDKFNGSVPVYKAGVVTFPCECNDKKYPGSNKQPETVAECTTCFVCGKQFDVAAT